MGLTSPLLSLQRLNSQFGTAVVLTSTWVELFSDPRLFAPQLVKSRDHRTLAIFATFLGGMCSTAVVYATNSSAVALGITTGASCLPRLGIEDSAAFSCFLMGDSGG